jgi:hypothetical protein
MVVERSHFPDETMTIKAGETLNVDGGFLRKPPGFRDFDFASCPANLGGQGRDDDESAGIFGIGVSENKHRSVLCDHAEIRKPNFSGNRVSIHRAPPSMLVPALRQTVTLPFAARPQREYPDAVRSVPSVNSRRPRDSSRVARGYVRHCDSVPWEPVPVAKWRPLSLLNCAQSCSKCKLLHSSPATRPSLFELRRPGRLPPCLHYLPHRLLQTHGDVPVGIMAPHFPEIGEITDVIADAVFVEVLIDLGFS